MTQTSSRMRARAFYSRKCNSASKCTMAVREDVLSRCVTKSRPQNVVKPGWVFSSFPPSNCDCLKWIHLKFASEYQSERSKPQSNKGWGLKIDSFFFFFFYTTPPPHPPNLISLSSHALLFGDYIMQCCVAFHSVKLWKDAKAAEVEV